MISHKDTSPRGPSNPPRKTLETQPNGPSSRVTLERISGIGFTSRSRRVSTRLRVSPLVLFLPPLAPEDEAPLVQLPTPRQSLKLLQSEADRGLRPAAAMLFELFDDGGRHLNHQSDIFICRRERRSVLHQFLGDGHRAARRRMRSFLALRRRSVNRASRSVKSIRANVPRCFPGFLSDSVRPDEGPAVVRPGHPSAAGPGLRIIPNDALAGYWPVSARF